MRRHWQYLKYVLRHKWYVFKACLQLGVPLWIALLHDWDKFLPDEWLPYARTFYAPDGTKRYQESVDFARAWMKHQHRNKHHWQYWLLLPQSFNAAGTDYRDCRIQDLNILVWDRGEAQRIVERNSGGETRYELRDVDVLISLLADFKPQPMPDVYRREMLADWRGAGAANGQYDTLLWYHKHRDNMILHPDTRDWIEAQLQYDPDLFTTVAAHK